MLETLPIFKAFVFLAIALCEVMDQLVWWPRILNCSVWLRPRYTALYKMPPRAIVITNQRRRRRCPLRFSHIWSGAEYPKYLVRHTAHDIEWS